MMFLLLVLVGRLGLGEGLSCIGECDPAQCKTPACCKSGYLTKAPGCNSCCQACAKAEGESCGGVSNLAGECGKGLRCLRQSEDISLINVRGVCVSDATAPRLLREAQAKPGEAALDAISSELQISTRHCRPVNCGNHKADSCENCPLDGGVNHGRRWCHGECVWKDNKCTAPVVNCGNHKADSCENCPLDGGVNHGKRWCNGDCVWKDNKCSTPVVNCGNHKSDKCENCPLDGGVNRGKKWCNGDCVWKDNKCSAPVECGSGWTAYDNSCYKVFTDKVTWEEANQTCVSNNADLLSIHSAEENAFVSDLVNGIQAWLGGRRECRGCKDFLWSDGTTWGYQNWLRRAGQPDNKGGVEDCTEHNYLVKGAWNDEPCDRLQPFICKQ